MSMKSKVIVDLADPALTSDVTLHVDKTTGDDSNPGTAELPLATLQAAVDYRNTYGELRAVLRVMLKGEGPYILPPILGSHCHPQLGRFVIQGDDEVEVGISGTVTTTYNDNTDQCVLQVTPALVVDAWANMFLEITSGPRAGWQFQIVENDANTISLACTYGLQFGAEAELADFQLNIPAGSSFRVWQPKTQLEIFEDNYYDVQAVPSGTSGWYDCGYAFTDSTGLTGGPSHALFKCRILQVQPYHQLDIIHSDVGFYGCIAEPLIQIRRNSLVRCGMATRDAALPPGTNGNRWYGAGLITGSSRLDVFGTCSIEGPIGGKSLYFSYTGAAIGWLGGRVEAPGQFIVAGALYSGAGAGRFIVSSTLYGLRGSDISFGPGIWKIRPSTGPCIRSDGGQVQISNYNEEHILPSASLDSPAIVLRRGAFCLWLGTLTLTGSPAGNDMQTDTQTKANSYFNSSDTVLNEAVGTVFIRSGVLSPSEAGFMNMNLPTRDKARPRKK